MHNREPTPLYTSAAASKASTQDSPDPNIMPTGLSFLITSQPIDLYQFYFDISLFLEYSVRDWLIVPTKISRQSLPLESGSLIRTLLILEASSHTLC